MAREDPTEHQRRPFLAKFLSREPHSRRYSGDEVEPVKHREGREAHERKAAEWQPKIFSKLGSVTQHANVSFGSLADIADALPNVRFTPKADVGVNEYTP